MRSSKFTYTLSTVLISGALWEPVRLCPFFLCLVSTNSSLSGVVTDCDKVGEDKICEEEETSKGQWTKVKGPNKANKYVEIVEQSVTTPDSDELVLTKHKKNGHSRTGPQSAPLINTVDNVNVNLEERMENLKVSEFQCKNCQEKFVKIVDLEKHIKTRHSIQWNCEQCDFQASTRAILMNHCKLTQGHKPSAQKQRLGETGVIECYTCRSEFRSYHNLMSHRKNEHPSHKKCRYFLKGTCNFSREECWYLHEEGTNTETNLDINVICNICRNMFMTKRDLMEHKKINHPLQVPANKSKQGKGVGSTD